MASFFDKDENPAQAQINTLLEGFNTPEEYANEARAVSAMMDKIEAAGQNVELAQPRDNLFWTALDYLDAPGQGIRGILDAAVRGDMFSPGVGTGFRRGQQENVTSSEVLQRAGILEDSPILRGIAGFAGDVILDPLQWLAPAALGATKIAGRAVTEAGSALKAAGVSRLANNVDDAIAVDNLLDDAFTGIAKYQEAAKNLPKAKTGAEMAVLTDEMSRAEKLFLPVFSHDEIVGKEIFKKPGIKAELNIPFLGHLLPDKKLAEEVIASDNGPIGKAFKAIGSALGIKKVKLGEYNFSDSQIEAIDNLRLFANEKLSKLGAAADAIGEIPLVGLPIKAGAAATRGVKDLVNLTSDSLKKVFSRKALVGARANDLALEHIGIKAGNKARAIQDTFEVLGPALRDKGLLKAVAMDIDNLMMTSAKATGAYDESFLSAINRMSETGMAQEGDLLDVRRALNTPDANGMTVETAFRQGMQGYLQNPGIPQAQKDLTVKVLNFMDQIALNESQHGLQTGLVEYYIPHRYQNMSKNRQKFHGTPQPNFLKDRKYNTATEAFDAQGYVADTNLAELMRGRLNKSLDTIAERQFAHRLFMEEGLDEQLITNLYKEAQLDPAGNAAKLIRRYRVDPKPLDKALLAEGEFNKAYSEAFASAAKGDAQAGERLAKMRAEFSQKTKEELWASGYRPKDNKVPDAFLGEIGEKVNIPGGGEVYLPKPIANMYREVTTSRDILKDAIGENRLGRAVVKLLDGARSWYSKAVTLPFPSYWGQNMLGGRWLAAMDSIHNYDPGVFVRAHNVMAGKSALRTPSGTLIDSKTFNRILRDNGINYSVNDMLGTVESFADMNIDSHLRESKGLLSNVLSGEKGSKIAALKQIHDKAQKGFNDGFARVAHIYHRLEKGDSIRDAVAKANELYFNYRDLTPAEQSFFRRFYMFYGFQSKATKKAFTDLVTNPGQLTFTMSGTRALSSIFQDPSYTPTLEDRELGQLRSAVTSEQLSQIIGKTKEGKPIIARGFAAPLNQVLQSISLQKPNNFSVGEIVGAATDSLTRTIQKQFAASNPVINAIAQGVSGKNLYFDKPLDEKFLRRLPDLTEAAERLSQFAHTDLPTDINETVKEFLEAKPDGRGRLIANPAKMWILSNLVPGMGRLISTTGAMVNPELSWKQALLRNTLGVNIAPQDVERTYLANQKDALSKFMRRNDTNLILQNQQEGFGGED